MKKKVSVTISTDALAGIDRVADSRMSRSAFIEQVLRHHLEVDERDRNDARDLELLNKAAAELNAEMEDVLNYQAPWK